VNPSSRDTIILLSCCKYSIKEGTIESFQQPNTAHCQLPAVAAFCNPRGTQSQHNKTTCNCSIIPFKYSFLAHVQWCFNCVGTYCLATPTLPSKQQHCLCFKFHSVPALQAALCSPAWLINVSVMSLANYCLCNCKKMTEEVWKQ